jgi:hypothetical protein
MIGHPSHKGLILTLLLSVATMLSLPSSQGASLTHHTIPSKKHSNSLKKASMHRAKVVAHKGNAKYHLAIAKKSPSQAKPLTSHHLKGKAVCLAHGTKAKPLPNPNVVTMLALQSGSAGVIHRRWKSKAPHGAPLLINMLVMAPNDAGLEIRPVLSNPLQLKGKRRLSQLASSASGAIAAINASYFKPDSGLPLGLVMVDKEVYSGPLFNRVCLGISPQGTFDMAQVTLSGQLALADGTSITIDTINQPRVSQQSVVLYSGKWGAVAPPMPHNGIQIAIVGNAITAVSTTQRLHIPKDGWVLSGPNQGALASMSLPNAKDTPISITLHTSPDWSGIAHAISGGPYLVKDGQVYVDTQAQRIRMNPTEVRAPRTAVGITASGQLLLVTVDGRQKRVSEGLTLLQMGQLMRRLGAVQAMNLDGGGSTQMVVAGRLVNSPSIPHGAAVSTALGIFKRDATVAVDNTNSPL